MADNKIKNTANISGAKKKKSLPLRLLKISGIGLVSLIGFIILLVVFVYVFIQTDTFNKYALEYTLDELNSSQEPKQNKINAESIDGNILNGITLNKGNVTVRNDTLLAFNYLEVKYNLWGLLDKRILVEKVHLSDPVISASRINSGDSTIWNFENLFGPSEPDTTPSSPFEWDVAVEELKIENGFVRVAGDSSQVPNRWAEKRSLMQMFDFNQTDVSELNLDLSAKYYKDFKTISLRNLSFKTNSEFNLHKLQLDANLNEKDTVTELWNFALKTDRSDINIYHLLAEDFNPFYDFVYEDLADKKIDLSLDIHKFNFDDLTFFLPEVNMLDSVVGVKLEASGKYGDLDAKLIEVRLPNSYINLSGKIVNLQQPDSMWLDVTGKNISINAKDITSIYKDNSLQQTVNDYGHLGIINADLHYKGTFTNFNSEFALNTSAGYADGVFNFNTESEIYSGYVNTRALNIGRIIKDNTLNGGLNMSAKFDGQGFELNKMNTNLVYSITGSRIGKYDVRNSTGTINAVRGNIALNIKHASSMGNAVVSGRVNISNMNNPVYNLKGNVQSLNVAAITGNSEDKSNLNASFNVNGRGASLDNISGVYQLDVGQSQYGEYVIPQTPVNAEINSSNSNGTVKLQTDMVDFNAEGSFKVGELVDAILYNITQVQNQIVQSTGTESLMKDSLGNSTLNTTNYTPYRGGDLTFNYKLVTKDSVKLGQVLQPFGVYFNGNATGEIKNTAGNFTSVTKLDVKNFTLNDTAIIVKNFKSDLNFNNNYSGGINGININLNALGDKLIFGSTSFDSVVTRYNMQGPNADLYVRAGMDTTAKAIIGGNLNFGAGSINADLDSVYVDYGGYLVENSGNWVFSFEQADKVKFQQFDIKSRNAILKLSGEFSLNNESDVRVEGDNIKITDLADIVNKADSSYFLSAEGDIEGEFTSLVAEYKGTLEAPELNLNIKTNTLKYKDTDMGVISIVGNYKDNVANADVQLNNAEGKGNLKIKGTIPYQNPLNMDTTLPALSGPVDINLKAENFLLDYFSTLFADASTLRGVLNADLSAKGTSEDPALTGNLKITEGGYLVPLTGMYHRFDVAVSTDNFKLVVDNIKLWNEDDESKHIDLYGSLDFKDLKIRDINLEARGDMVVLDNSVEQNDLGVYGYVLAGIGTPPIKVTGSLDSMFVTGQLLIKEATISSIPLEGKGYSIEDDNFVYTDAGNDSLLIYNLDSMKLAVTEEEYNLLNPFDRFKYAIQGERSSAMFLNLDVNVKTEDNIYASIDFNNLTRDRLFGELKADLDIKTVDGEMQAFGTVDVDGDSYYRFYRDFKLDESQIKFDGNISNPVLDIKGVYESQKSTEQLGGTTTSDVQVVIRVTGEVKKPELKLLLFVDGSEVSGSDAQSDAITYLLFGRFKNELTPTERTAVASSLGASVGSLYASSYLSQQIREVLPFIVDAQFNYTEGSVKDTDVELISELGDARVKFGGKLLKDVKNFEVVVDYPLNKLFNLNLPETLLLEFSREEKKQTLSTNSSSDILTTEVKILYKIKF